MPSEKFRITTNGQSLRNPSNGFFGMTLSANMTLDESDISAHNDRRSAHNALERQRREHLNIKFQQLAHALPALQAVRRPSKTMIVAKSLEFVSSSLKRESTFTSEIQKLRLENERLRKQAESSSNHLKKQLANDKDTTTLNDTKEEVKPSLKRKANHSDAQLSPPPTPEANGNKPQKVSPSIVQPRKKRMLKQTKSLQPHTKHQQVLTSPTQVPSNVTAATAVPATTNASTTTITTTSPISHTTSAPLIESPWSPVDDSHLSASLLSSYPNNNTPPTYFDMTSPPTANNMLFMADSQVMLADAQYQDSMISHSMLLAPYYIPSATSETATATANFFPFTPLRQRQQSGDFYLS